MLYELITVAYLLFPDNGFRMRIIEKPRYFSTYAECEKAIRPSVDDIARRIQKIVSERKQMARSVLESSCKGTRSPEAALRRVKSPA